MGVPTSEVGYTIATTRRETTKVHKNMWWHWGGNLREKVLSLTASYTFASHEVTVHPGLGINYNAPRASISDEAANRNGNFLFQLWSTHSHKSFVSALILNNVHLFTAFEAER